MSKCVKKDGECVPFMFPDAPDQSVILPFVQPESEPARVLPPGITDEDARLLYIGSDTPIVDIAGSVPAAGFYVLVAKYYQPNQAEFELPMNVTTAPAEGQALDLEEQLASGQYVAAVLPLPPCASNTGCRSVIETVPKEGVAKGRDFDLTDVFILQTANPEQKPAWLESVIAIPSENFDEGFLSPERVDKSRDFALQCGQNHFYVSTEEEGYCKEAVLSVAAEFNGGALECDCDGQGTVEGETTNCAKMGGQCTCKPNVIGRQCTR